MVHPDPEPSDSAAGRRSDQGHGHGHGHGGHQHRSPGAAGSRGLLVAIVLNGGLAVGQIIAGLAFGSVAVLADAGHQAVDAVGLALGALSVRLARRPATPSRTWGWGRADALGAQFSAVVLLASLAWVVIEAIRRLGSPEAVTGLGVLIVGVIGVAVNGGSLLALGQIGEHLAMRAARLHLLADLAGSLVLVGVGAAVRATGWDRLDPIASLALSLSLLYSTAQLLRHTARVLLDATPRHLDVDEIARVVRADAGVRDLHHVHVWTVAPGVTALSAHVDVDGEQSVHAAQDDLERVETVLRTRFGIGHTTLQLECHPCATPAHDHPVA